MIGLAFDRAGALLASVRDDGTAQLWDLATRAPVGEPITDARVGGNATDLQSLVFSPDGRTVATGYGSGAVALWRTTSWLLMRSTMRSKTGADG